MGPVELGIGLGIAKVLFGLHLGGAWVELSLSFRQVSEKLPLPVLEPLFKLALQLLLPVLN